MALSPATVRRLACDAGVIPAVLDNRSAVLDIGRRTSTVGSALRHALTLRDSGCAFPECDRPPSWCDAHHVKHWADVGPTDLANLVLLGSAHHHLIHEDRWSIRPAPDGRHRFESPTGQRFSARPTPGSGPSPGVSPRRE